MLAEQRKTERINEQNEQNAHKEKFKFNLCPKKNMQVFIFVVVTTKVLNLTILTVKNFVLNNTGLPRKQISLEFRKIEYLAFFINFRVIFFN